MTHPSLSGPRRTVQLEDATLAYLDTGGTKPAVLLLHGAYLSKREWRAQTAGLCSRFRIIAPDLRAHGDSGRQGRPYSVQQFARDIETLLDSLGVEHAHVCGHSLGGMVAMQLACTRPERVRSLVLAETSYGTSSTRVEATLSAWSRPLFRRASLRWQARMFAQTLSKHTPELHAYLEEEILKYADDRGTYDGIWDAVLAFDGRARLAGIHRPSLVVVGERNRQTHRQGRAISSLIPGARLKVLPAAGHMLNMDQPAAFNDLLLDFWSA